MKEHYVSYECAQALKRLGFKEEVSHYYVQFKSDGEVKFWSTNPPANHNERLSINEVCSAPRLDQAQAWLREVKNVIVCPFPERYKEYVVQGIYRERLSGWDYEIWVNEEEYSEPKFGYIESYEKALELGIDKALELLTDKS